MKRFGEKLIIICEASACTGFSIATLANIVSHRYDLAALTFFGACANGELTRRSINKYRQNSDDNNTTPDK